MMWKKLFGKSDVFTPRMPEVDVPAAIDDIFRQAREAAADPASRRVIVVTPGRMLMLQDCPAPGTMDPQAVAGIAQIISPSVRRNIAVIAYTELRALRTDITKTIPFIGMLMGLSYIGHAVWVFEGHSSALNAGCKDADVLVVDGEMIPYMTADWSQVASRAMRHPEIYAHERASFSLRKINQAQQS